jgi:hypothetical protein
VRDRCARARAPHYRCSRAAARRGPSSVCAARTTRSARRGRRGRHSPARRSPCRDRGQRREALRLLLIARRSAVDVRRQALGQLRSVIVTAPDQLRQVLRELPLGRLLDRCRRLRRLRSASANELSTRLVLRSLARRIEAATAEADELECELLGHVRAVAPRLLEERAGGTDRCRPAARRIAEGKSRRDATRLLKRYLARRLYRPLQHQERLMT